MYGEDLIIREESHKLDLDSEEGQAVCKNFLGCLEKFFTYLQLRLCPRDYRLKFSRAYKVLY